jgi:hypothetical protein
MAMDVLRIKVAEARGWRIFDEQGNPIAYPFNEVDLSGIPPGEAMDEPVPSYTTSMDACMELLDELSENNVSWMLENYGKSGYRFIIIFDEERALAFRSDQICMAVCDGYMAWKEEQ